MGILRLAVMPYQNSRFIWLVALTLTLITVSGIAALALEQGFAALLTVPGLTLVLSGCTFGLAYLVFGRRGLHRVSQALGYPVFPVSKPADVRLAIFLISAILFLVLVKTILH